MGGSDLVEVQVKAILKVVIETKSNSPKNLNILFHFCLLLTSQILLDYFAPDDSPFVVRISSTFPFLSPSIASGSSSPNPSSFT